MEKRRREAGISEHSKGRRSSGKDGAKENLEEREGTEKERKRRGAAPALPCNGSTEHPKTGVSNLKQALICEPMKRLTLILS